MRCGTGSCFRVGGSARRTVLKTCFTVVEPRILETRVISRASLTPSYICNVGSTVANKLAKIEMYCNSSGDFEMMAASPDSRAVRKGVT